MEAEIYNLYYEIASGVSRSVKQLIIGIMFAALCRHFMVSAKARRRVWMVTAAYFAAVVVYLYIPTEVYAFTVYLAAILAAFFVLCALEKENRQVKFLLCCIFFSVRWIASNISSELSYFAEIRIEEWVILKSGISEEHIARTLYFIFCGSRVAECMLTALVLYEICKGIERMFFFKRSGMEKKEMLLLMMPAATGMFYIITSERSRSAVLKKTDMYLNDMVPQFELMEFAMEIILLAAIMSMLWLYQKLRQEQEKKQSDRLLLQEVRSMRAHIEEVERLQEHLRGMRHDMKNHISVLQGLMERGAFAHAQTYLDSMGRSYSEAAGKAGAENSGKQMDGEDTGDGGMQPEGGSDSPDRACGIGGSDSPDRACGIGGSDSLDRACGIGGNDSLDRACGMDESGRRAEIRTGNPVTDVILAEHQRRIAEAGAAFWADFHYPDSKEIDVFDLSVILDNALTNAREALPQNGWVLIRSFREHHAYLIVIENAFEGELAARGAEGLPMTTKQPPEEHGFGLRHIKTIVEHYHGAVTMEQKGDMVQLSVMLCV